MKKYKIAYYKNDNNIIIFYIQQRRFLFFWKPYKKLTNNGWYYPQFVIKEKAKDYIDSIKKGEWNINTNVL